MYIDHKFQSRVKPNHIFKFHLLKSTINYRSNPIHICVPFITKHSDTKHLAYIYLPQSVDRVWDIDAFAWSKHTCTFGPLVAFLWTAWREKYDAESHSVVLEFDWYKSDSTFWSQPDGGYPFLTILPGPLWRIVDSTWSSHTRLS